MNMEVQFTSRIELAPDVWEYSFVSAVPMDFIPGQYAKFWFANDTSLGGRTFTLTSRPGDTVATFIVRFPNPMSDYKHALQTMQPGTVMRYEQPMGDAILPRDPSTPLVFLAQGIGIASYIPILRECKEKSLPFNVALFWTHRESDSKLRTSFETYVTPTTTLHEYTSPARVESKDVLGTAEPASLYYLSGSQNFVEHLGAELENRGILRERMIYDYYEGYTTL